MKHKMDKQRVDERKRKSVDVKRFVYLVPGDSLSRRWCRRRIRYGISAVVVSPAWCKAWVATSNTAAIVSTKHTTPNVFSGGFLFFSEIFERCGIGTMHRQIHMHYASDTPKHYGVVWGPLNVILLRDPLPFFVRFSFGIRLEYSKFLWLWTKCARKISWRKASWVVRSMAAAWLFKALLRTDTYSGVMNWHIQCESGHEFL